MPKTTNHQLPTTNYQPPSRRLRNRNRLRRSRRALVPALVDRGDLVAVGHAELHRDIEEVGLVDRRRAAELQAYRAVPAIDEIAGEVGGGDGVPEQADEIRLHERGDFAGRGRRNQVAEGDAGGRGGIALQQRRAGAGDGGDTVVVLGVRRGVRIGRALHRRGGDRRRQLIERLARRVAVEVIADDHRRTLIADRLLRLVPRHHHALRLRRGLHARGHDGVGQPHGTVVRRAQRRRVGEEKLRARGRVRKVGLFYALDLRAEPDELRLRYCARRHGERLDVAKDRDPADLGQALAGGRHRGIAPRKNHLVGALCYNQ